MEKVTCTGSQDLDLFTWTSDLQTKLLLGRRGRDRMVVWYITGLHMQSVPIRRGVLNTTLCDEVCQWLVAGRWFSPGTPVSSTNKTDHHDIAEILLKMVLNTITHTKPNRVMDLFSKVMKRLYMLPLTLSDSKL